MEDKVDKTLDDLFRALEDWYNAKSHDLYKTEATLGDAYKKWLELAKEDTPGENE